MPGTACVLLGGAGSQRPATRATTSRGEVRLAEQLKFGWRPNHRRCLARVLTAIGCVFGRVEAPWFLALLAAHEHAVDCNAAPVVVLQNVLNQRESKALSKDAS